MILEARRSGGNLVSIDKGRVGCTVYHLESCHLDTAHLKDDVHYHCLTIKVINLKSRVDLLLIWTNLMKAVMLFFIFIFIFFKK